MNIYESVCCRRLSISLIFFFSSLLLAFPQILDGESKVSIANKFAVPGTGGEQIDYAQCFRAYLRQATVRFVPAVIQAVRNSKKRILNK